MHDRKCFANHMGLWLIESGWFSQAFQAIQSGLWKPPIESKLHRPEDHKKPFAMTENGIAVIPLDGPLMKGSSKFGGTSTVFTRQMIRAAARDRDVSAIMLQIDSPGGHAAGTHDLAMDVRQADGAKPVVAHIDDLGASAAFWIASQARRITAGPVAEIGSIGTVAVVFDESEKFKEEGVKAHVISTGAFKGAFITGAPVPKAHLDDLQRRVDDLNAHFLEAVAVGRKMSPEAVAKAADGRVFSAKAAQDMGLIDGIGSMDDAIRSLSTEIESDRLAAQRKLASQDTQNRIRQAGL